MLAYTAKELLACCSWGQRSWENAPPSRLIRKTIFSHRLWLLRSQRAGSIKKQKTYVNNNKHSNTRLPNDHAASAAVDPKQRETPRSGHQLITYVVHPYKFSMLPDWQNHTLSNNWRPNKQTAAWTLRLSQKHTSKGGIQTASSKSRNTRYFAVIVQAAKEVESLCTSHQPYSLLYGPQRKTICSK